MILNRILAKRGPRGMLFGGTTKGTAQGSRYGAQGENSEESGPKGTDLRISGVRCQGKKTKQLKPV
jgi:hypothetical protein